MNAANGKTPKKAGSKTPGKRQLLLSSFFVDVSPPGNVELGKKCKLGRSKFSTNDDRSKRRKTLAAAEEAAADRRRARPGERQATGVQKNETQISGTESERRKQPGGVSSRDEKKCEVDLAVKENSPKLSYASEVKHSEIGTNVVAKNHLPLNIVSQNVRFLDRGKELSSGDKFVEGELAKEEKKLSSVSGKCEKDFARKDTKNEDLSRAVEECFGFEDDDDFLFETLDESFGAKGEPEKTSKDDGSEVRSHTTTLTDELDDIFSADWTGDARVEVDLTNLQRCKVSNTGRDNFLNLIVNVVHVETQIPVTVTLMDFWKDTRLGTGDIVNIQATKRPNGWIVDNNGGFVVEQPDFLVSGTSVVGALFCRRRGVLSDKFKGIESASNCKQGASVMTIGSLVHELLQEVLRKKIYTKLGITRVLNDILNSQDTAKTLYSAGISTASCAKEMSVFVPKIFHFIERYVKDKTPCSADENFAGKINVVRDIEENLWVPQLGIKGKVDVTVEASVNLKPRIMPLEVKTGRASFSLEHRGQVILYTMMMAVTGRDVDAGLLLYLRENIMREVKVGHPERRDLILLRNNLAYHLTRRPEIPNQADSRLESESMELPEPIDHRACGSCPYSALCCAYLKNDGNYPLSDRHPLTPIIKNLDNYLKPEHIDYVKRWVKMLRINEVDEVDVRSLSSLWTVPAIQREKTGKCISNLKIIGDAVEKSRGVRYTFARVDSDDRKVNDDLTKSGFDVTQYIVISTDTKVNVCAGPIIELFKDSITVLLERNLGDQRSKDIFHIDAYLPQSTLVINLSNIGYLLDDNTDTERIRRIVIDRQPATFSTKLNRSVVVAAAKIFEPLNKVQRRAVLKVIAANDYLLIKGMPGSGKTLTLVAIIQLLVKMGKSVLLTAHTHSAVDNVLLKLIKTGVDFLRLGSTSRIHPLLSSKSESVLTRECHSPEALEEAYNSKNVICVTCLGSNHPLLGRRTFDVCLVDESTQVLESTLLRPLYSASKFVLIGDPDQLPPIVRSNAARELGMDRSLFERLDSENNTITLTSQYRMNQRIMSIANQVTYKGQLTVGADDIGNATLSIPDKSVINSCHRWVRAALSTDLDDSVVVLDTGDTSNVCKDDTGLESNDHHVERKCSNLCEAAVILHLITILVKGGVAADKIGVIAPYRQQVNLLRDVVERDVEVNTVDQYQGRDKDIILYSGTRSGYVRSNAGQQFQILDDHRRLSVAITRAKCKLIMVGDVGSLRQFVPFEKFLEKIRSKDVIVLRNSCADFIWEELISAVKQ